MTKTLLLFVFAIQMALFTASAQETPPAPPVNGLFDSIHVVVGPSRSELQSIAIMPVGCPESGEACSKAGRTVSRDLELSGFFKVLDPASFIADPAKESLVATAWADWMNVGASWLVKYSVQGSGGSMGVEFRLYDITQKAGRPVKSQSFPDVGPGGIRSAAHKFVNAVILEITGEPGIFGSRIVVSLKTGMNSRDIVTMEMDGAGRDTLVSNGSSNMFPKWTRGGKLIYTSFESGIPQIYLGKERLTHDEYQYRSAEMSPDGSVIVASVDMGEQSDLVLISPKNGQIVKRLTDTEWDEVSPTWSNGGNLIAYVSSKGGNPQIYIMNSDGTGERRLTMAGTYNTQPKFGPDNRVVFSGMDMFRSDLFFVDLEGNISRLTQEQGNNKDGAWSPDGRYLVFLSDRTGKWKVWIMTADGRWQFPISSDDGWFGTPDWR